MAETRSARGALLIEQARRCATLALIPGTHFDPATAAAALDVHETTARRVLRSLCDANMLPRPMEDDRFSFHDMLRRFATGRALELLSEDDRQEIAQRVIEQRWRRVVALNRSMSNRPVPVPARVWFAGIEPAFTGPGAVREAFDELDREGRNLLATADEARKLPGTEISCLFPLGLWFFAFQTARHEEIVEAYALCWTWPRIRCCAGTCCGTRRPVVTV